MVIKYVCVHFRSDRNEWRMECRGGSERVSASSVSQSVSQPVSQPVSQSASQSVSQSVSMYVATDRVRSGVRFNIRPQAGCIRAFWCNILGIIAHILFIMEDVSVKYNSKH
jgi:hypothetical protein